MSGEEFILPFNHSETLNIDIPNLNFDTKKYTYDKKKLGHLVSVDNVVDVNLLYYMSTNEPLNIDDIETNYGNLLTKIQNNITNYNSIISADSTKIYGTGRSIFSRTWYG